MKICGPIQPFGRIQNPDGTWTIGAHAQCEVPDPNPWSHAYTLIFPSKIVYANGDAFKFMGSATASVQGVNNPRGYKVTVDTATLTDPSANNNVLAKTEIGTARDPVDQWSTTTPLQADTLYTFTVSGTDAGVNKASDTLVIDAIYEQVVD